MNYGLNMLFNESNAKLGFDPLCLESLPEGNYTMVMSVTANCITWQLHEVLPDGTISPLPVL